MTPSRIDTPPSEAHHTHHDAITNDGWGHSPTTIYSKAFHSGFFGLMTYVPEHGWGWGLRQKNCTVVLASGFTPNLLQARASVVNELDAYKRTARRYLEEAQGHYVLAAQAIRTRAGQQLDTMSPYKALIELVIDAENWDSGDDTTP